ncbi:hypothetical protein AWC38_SpisGene16924 [Stylophora pistillata]|uniref:Reverse transcriptase zinc-binding domain-containing protein n=1 Tax=Stylophora pistillata TaxID=50429 RepID=A0A2B4RQ78_STYPI|nr:hypothetical protein AWC38_SpisGene16924 [Stylophora pistillata]
MGANVLSSTLELMETNAERLQWENIGKQVQDAKDVKLNETSVVKNLESGSNYKFLGIKESVMQDEKQALKEAAKVYFRRLSVIWTSPLSDFNRVLATNQFALPALTYPMWTQHWPLAELRDIDRQTRKIICENGGRHPLSSIAVLYLPREKGGRGLRAIEQEYKLIKIKAAVKLYESLDPKMKSVQQFEECAIPNRRTRDSYQRYALKKHIKKVVNEKLVKKVEDQQWQGGLLKARWQDNQLSLENCLAWLNKWHCAPTHCIAGIMELYEQLTPTKVYMAYKTGITDKNDVKCRMCGEGPESMAHVLAGCPSLAQSKYLERHNFAFKVFFFEMLKDLKLADFTPPWFSDVKPKPLYKSPDAEAYWDLPVDADHTYVQSNRVDARFIDHKNKKVFMVDMSCPWINNGDKKDKEKTKKYGSLRLELTKQHPGFKIS